MLTIAAKKNISHGISISVNKAAFFLAWDQPAVLRVSKIGQKAMPVFYHPEE